MMKRYTVPRANKKKETLVTLKQWLAVRLVEKQISQRRLATLMELDAGSLNRTIAGKRRLQINEATDLAKLLDVPLDEVLERFGLASGIINDVDLVGAVNDKGMFEPLLHKVKVRAVPQGEHLVAIQMRSDGAMDGFLFYVESHEVPVETDKLGLLILADGSSIVGVALRGYLPNRYRVSTINKDKMDDVEVVSMKRVKAVLPP